MLLLSALQSPIEYQKEQSQGATSTLRKTNSQPASMMLSTLTRPASTGISHSQYARMTSDPQAKTSNRLRNEEPKDEKTASRGAEKVRDEDVKGQRRSGSPQQSKRTLFGGLRSSLIRLSKSPSHEDFVRETSTATDVNATSDTATARAADDSNDDDVKVDCEADRLATAEDSEPATTAVVAGADADCATTNNLPRLNGKLTPAADSTSTVIPGNHLLLFK